MIFNTNNGCMEFFNGALWVSACDGSLQPGPVSDCSTTGFIAPYITADETEIVDVIVTLVGGGTQTWMDRNLGAISAARASDDCYAYGNLHQWGRGNDGHEDRNSNVTPGPVAAGNEGSDFITSSGDWLSSPDDNRWDGATKGPEDPCPAGYRVPTETELQDLEDSFSPNNSSGAISSPLKLPVAGFRSGSNGALLDVGSVGRYWSSTLSGAVARSLYFDSSFSFFSTLNRADGFSVRCLKD